MIANTLETLPANSLSQRTLDNLGGILDSATHHAIVATDRDGLIQLWNDGARQLYGHNAGDVIGRLNWEKLFDPNDVLAALHREILAIAWNAGSWAGNLVQCCDDGRRFAGRAVVTPWRDRNNEIIGVIMIVQQAAATDPVDMARSDSWSLALERKELEDQLRQAQKMEAIGRLAGGVAHDFNNLLTVINGYSELLVEYFERGDPLREFVEQIHRAGDRAAALTRQLLTFSRKQMIVPVVVDLNFLLSEMAKMFSRTIGEDIHLRINPADNLWKIHVDPGQIEQVIMNLVINARDAMPQGGNLSIQTANVELDDESAPLGGKSPYVMLTLSDSGCGMDAITQARIFEPFFTTKGPDKGTGLGLATVYGIVKQSKGRIDVLSKPGLGTTFKIYFPRALDEVTHVKAHHSPHALHRGAETVLLVEDDESVRNLTRIVLEGYGYRVVVARSGSEGLELCEHYPDPIDIMVTDVVMPNMSGRVLAQHLAKLRPKMKALYLSGYTDDAIMRHGVVDAEMPFLQKPFATEKLAEKVREVLDAENGG